MTTVLEMTERRLNALRWVAEGAVEYDVTEAEYFISGEIAKGWDWRTLSELRGAKLVKPTAEKGRAPVIVTEDGQAVLNNPTG